MIVDPNDIQRVLDDLSDDNLPPMEDIEEALAKISCELIHGQRIYWYFREDVEYAQEYAFDPEEDDDGNEIPVTEEEARAAVRQDPPYSGLCVPLPGQLIDGRDVDINEVLVVIDRYPTDKCDPEAEWVALNRLLANPDIVEVFTKGGHPLTLEETMEILGAEEKQCPNCAVLLPGLLPGSTR